KDHRGGADYGRADQHRFRRGLKRISCAVVLFEEFLGLLEFRIKAELGLNVLMDPWEFFDGRELINRLSIVCDGTIGIDCDRHRSHPQKTERHETEGKDGWG